jgi:hypothetical protein
MCSIISLSSQIPLRVFCIALFFLALPLAQAGLKEVKRSSLEEVDYVTFEYRNTTKHPITVQLRVHNNALYDKKTKRWLTKPLTFPPFSLQPGDVREGIVFTVPRGEIVQHEEVGGRRAQGESIREVEPGSWRNATQAERDAAARRKLVPTQPQAPERTAYPPAKDASKFDEMLDAEFQKRLIGTWQGGPAEDPWVKNATSRIEFRPDGNGTVTINLEYKRPRNGVSGHKFAFDFSYRSLGGGVWDADFLPVRTISGDGVFPFPVRSSLKKGTFTMIEGRVLRGSRKLDKFYGDFRKQ